MLSSDRETWFASAICAGAKNLFFSPHVCDEVCDGPGGCTGRKERGRHERVRLAKSVCRACPVREQCLEYAIKNNIPYGVWGGLSERERRNLIKRRIFSGSHRP